MKPKKKYLGNELGIFLRTMRRKRKLKLLSISKSLKLSTSNFISRIENGAAIVPISRIPEIAKEYGLNEAMLARIVISTMHPEVWTALVRVILTDSELVSHATNLHAAKTEDTRGRHVSWIENESIKESILWMRKELGNAKEFIQPPKWKRQGHWGDPEIPMEND